MRTSNTTLTSEKIVDMVNKGKMKFDNPVQRQFVWDDERQSLLISSILNGYIMGAVVADKCGENKNWYYDILDGQQRLTTIVRFMNNELELTGVLPIEFEDTEYDIEGLTYEELPEELQKEIRTYNILMIYCEGATQAEKAEMFRRLNNGKPITAGQAMVAYLNGNIKVDEISKHEIFNTLLTTKGLADKKQSMYIAKVWTMLNSESLGDVSFVSKEFRPMIERAKFTDEQLDEVASIFDYMKLVLEVADEHIKKNGKASPYKRVFSKLKKEVHFVSLVPFVKRAIEMKMTVNHFFSFASAALHFSPTALYVKASQSDTSKTRQICDRHDELEARWNELFANYVPVNVTVVEVEPTAEVEESAKDSEPQAEATSEEEVA